MDFRCLEEPYSGLPLLCPGLSSWSKVTTGAFKSDGPISKERFNLVELMRVLHLCGYTVKRDKVKSFGSAQEFVETRILGCFLKKDEFGLGDRHALGLEQ
jgi:hypothetical protein